MAEHQAEIEKMIQIARETLDIAIKGLEGNLWEVAMLRTEACEKNERKLISQ